MPIDRGLRQFFAIAAILALIAGILLFIGAGETDRFFSWTIEPPLTAAFLGAAYWAAFLLLGWAARQREWAMARTAVPPVFVIAVLLLVATLVHLDRFDLDSVFGWFWLIVYVAVVPLLASWWHGRCAPPGESRRERGRSRAGFARHCSHRQSQCWESGSRCSSPRSTGPRCGPGP